MKYFWRFFFSVGFVFSGLGLQAQITRDATATATTFNGFVVGVTINDGGTGYTFPPNVSFNGAGSGAGAYSVISNGVVTQIVVTNAGSGYTSVPSVIIDAPSTLHYSFYSGNAYVVVPDSPSLDSTTNQLTIECWFNIVSYPDDWNVMLSKEDSTFNLTGYYLANIGNSANPIIKICPQFYNNGTAPNNNLTLPAWHHLATEYDQTNFSIWLDGNLLYITNYQAQIMIGSNPLTIGCQNSGYRPFNGYIAEVRISNTIRYTNLFNPQVRFNSDSNTIALYHFDEGSGSVVHDSSGCGNDGVIQGDSDSAWSTNEPSFSATTINIHKAVYVDFSNLLVGTSYQLQISTNLNNGTWCNFGTSFTATNQTMSFPKYWKVSDWNQLYFRLSP